MSQQPHIVERLRGAALLALVFILASSGPVFTLHMVCDHASTEAHHQDNCKICRTVVDTPFVVGQVFSGPETSAVELLATEPTFTLESLPRWAPSCRAPPV